MRFFSDLEPRLAELPFATGHGAASGRLGLASLYYVLPYSMRARVCVCIGSGGGLVPALMAQAQRDSGVGGVTCLIDAVAPEAGYGGPDIQGGWLGGDSVLFHDYPEVTVLTLRSDAAASTFFRKNGVRIDVLHIDGDHSYEGVRADFADYAPLLSGNAVVTLHDTRMDGPRRFVRELRRDRAYDVTDFADVGQGLALIRRRDGRRLPPVAAGAYMERRGARLAVRSAEADEENRSMWPYLETQALRSRYAVAGFLLADCREVVEIGGYRTPLSANLPSRTKVTVIDPLLEGEPPSANARHLKIDFDAYDYLQAHGRRRYGVAFLGFDMHDPDKTDRAAVLTLSRFLHFLSRSEKAVIEHPLLWPRSARQYSLLLSILQPRITFETVMDFRGQPFDGDPPPASRLLRKLVCLTDFERPSLEEITGAVRRLLFGTVLDHEPRNWAPSKLKIDLAKTRLAYGGAQMTIEDDAVHVTTAPLSWSYATLTPFTWPSSRATELKVRVTLAVETGEIVVALVTGEGAAIFAQQGMAARPGEPQVVDLLVPPQADVDGLLILNGGDASHSSATLRLVEVVERAPRVHVQAGTI